MLILSEEQYRLIIFIRSLIHKPKFTEGELLCVSNQNNAIVIFCVELRASLLFFKTRERRIAPHRVASWTIIITIVKLFPVWEFGCFSMLICFKTDPIVPHDYFRSLVCGLKYFRVEFEQDNTKLMAE